MWAAPTTTLFLIFYSCSLIFPRSSGSAVLLLPESAGGSQHFFGKFFSIFSTMRRMAWMKGQITKPRKYGTDYRPFTWLIRGEAQNDPAGAGTKECRQVV
jgi:hypothetical protein